jgi:hypothetical protein
MSVAKSDEQALGPDVAVGDRGADVVHSCAHESVENDVCHNDPILLSQQEQMLVLHPAT